MLGDLITSGVECVKKSHDINCELLTGIANFIRTSVQAKTNTK